MYVSIYYFVNSKPTSIPLYCPTRELIIAKEEFKLTLDIVEPTVLTKERTLFALKSNFNVFEDITTFAVD